MKLFRTFALATIMAAAPFAAHAGNSRDGENRAIQINNNSDYEVYRIYYGVPGQAYYSRDLLGDDVIGSSSSQEVNVDDGSGRCIYNLKAVTRSGNTFWEKKLNVCTESEWNLTN